MAALIQLSFLLSVLSLTLISSYFTPIHGSFSQQSNLLIKSPTEQPRTEKLTRLHFFLHENLEGKDPTEFQIIKPVTATGFGTCFMMDNLLTEGKELSSKAVGRAQGLFGLASLHDRGLAMLINFVFSDESDYAGSTLNLIGRNPVQDTVRELPIVGGTGVFRFAKGYVIAKSLWNVSTSQNFVVEYDVTVSHL